MPAAKVTLKTTDKRMLQLVEILQGNGIIRYRQEFCDAVGIEKQNIIAVKKGARRFTAEHIENACRVYKVNPSWIFGFDKQVFR